MSLFIILCSVPGVVRLGERLLPTGAGQLYLLLSSAEPLLQPTSTPCYRFQSGELQVTYSELQALLPAAGVTAAALHTLHPVAADPAVLDTMADLGQLNRVAMLHFVLIYCLVNAGDTCTALLQRAIAGDRDMFDYIHRHRLEAWPVQRYADALGISLRKFNQLFKDKFGVSPKHWLLLQRLQHARHLLQTTSKKVIDVAFESGFSNHAHFSDSFRRHFCLSPSDVRRGQRICEIDFLPAPHDEVPL